MEEEGSFLIPLRAFINDRSLWQRQWEFWKGSGGHNRSINEAMEDLAHNPFMARDLDILHTLYDAWIMDTESIGLMFFRRGLDGARNEKPTKMAQYRLHALWKLGLLLRGRPSPHHHSGSMPYLYHISRLGYEVLKRTRWYGPYAECKEDRGYAETSGDIDRILHHAEASQFIVHWLTAIDESGYQGQVHWRPVGRATCDVSQGLQRVRLVPDGIVTLEDPDPQHAWSGRAYFVEWERTADVGRFRTKLDHMALMMQNDNWRAFSLPAPPVYLVVAWERPDEHLSRTWGSRGRLSALVNTARWHEAGDRVIFLRGEDLEQDRYRGFTSDGTEVALA